jgi:signal transduction histidine kinase/CheY-like chemotaxis protein
MQLVGRFEAWLVPAESRANWRTPFLVRTWLFGLAFALGFGLLAARQGLWPLAAMLGGLFLSGVLCLGLFKWTARLRLVTNVSLALAAPFLAFIGLAQSPPNPLTPVFLVLVPLLAGFMLSRGEAVAWLVVVMVLGAVSEWAMANGFHVQGPPREHFGVVMALNLVAFMLLVLAFVRWFDGMRRDTLATLEAAGRARTIFLANISHEIRTPMNGVLGLTELVLAGHLEPEQRERLELVQRSGQSLVTLIDDLLLVTRAESGRLVLSPGPTAVAKVVADVVELFSLVANQKGLRLTARVEPEVPALVLLDGIRWRQAVTNLVSNAVKFTERGEVEVRLGARDGRLVLEVKDQGPGIAPEVQARLFRPFEQADASTTRRFGGSGLGLALSRQLIEAMGGSLTLRSVLGEGSVFVIDLPLVVAQGAGEVTKAPAATAPSRRPVLVVDDNPINLLVARGLVERAGFVVQVARDGREAVDAVEHGDFAMVLMDCQMPVMDGLEATRQIRAAHRDTPIVAVTASGLPEELDACRAAGMDDCLVKPISYEAMLRVLAHAR